MRVGQRRGWWTAASRRFGIAARRLRCPSWQQSGFRLAPRSSEPWFAAWVRLTGLAVPLVLAAGVAAVCLAPVQAATQIVAATPGAATPGAATPAVLRLTAQPPPLAAEFAVTVAAPGIARSATVPVRRHTWYFLRDAARVALLKGRIDESWRRDRRGRISFERVFHDRQRVIDYSTGELATLNVQSDWAALACFVDPRELLALKVVSRSVGEAGERLRLAGSSARGAVRIDWLPAVQLPALVVRRSADGGTTRIELVRQAKVAPAAWPVPGARSSRYLHLDAADFGDMEYEPVVRESEALDIRHGWRAAHRHD